MLPSEVNGIEMNCMLYKNLPLLYLSSLDRRLLLTTQELSRNTVGHLQIRSVLFLLSSLPQTSA